MDSRSNRLGVARIALALLSLAITATAVYGETQYPTQPIRFLVKAVAGGGPDTVARIVAQDLQERIHQPVIVENRPGANGTVAAVALNDAPADGYTFVVADGSLISTNPFLYRKLPYDPQELVPVALVARAPIMIAVNQQVPVSTMREFVDYVRAHPGQLNYGSSGIGSVHHLTMEAVKADLHLDIVHIPYKGTGESVPALLGGYVQIALAAYPSLKGYADDKLIKLLAINGAKPIAMAPEVPPISDTIPGFDLAPIIGLYARKGTPVAIVQELAREISAIVKTPKAAREFAVVGLEPEGGGPDEFARALKTESRRIAVVIKEANIEPQ